MANGENQQLQDLFAAECAGHLAALRACLAPLAVADGDSAAAAAIRLGASLHTLAGAARAVELHDLEYLCRALEGLAAASGPRWDAPALILLDAALQLAPSLLGTPSGRQRNQLMALAAQCADAATSVARS